MLDLKNIILLSFNWWDVYHHLLLIVTLSIFVLLMALVLNKSAYTVKYVNYLLYTSLIVLLILLPVNIICMKSIYINFLDFLVLAFYLIGGTFIITILINISDLSFIRENKEIEFPMLIIIGFIFTILLIGSNNLISVFLCLEGLAFLSYVLVAFERVLQWSSLAAIRYIFIGAVPSGLFILGSTEFYYHLGSLNLIDIQSLLYGLNEIFVFFFDLYKSNFDFYYNDYANIVLVGNNSDININDFNSLFNYNLIDFIKMYDYNNLIINLSWYEKLDSIFFIDEGHYNNFSNLLSIYFNIFNDNIGNLNFNFIENSNSNGYDFLYKKDIFIESYYFLEILQTYDYTKTCSFNDLFIYEYIFYNNNDLLSDNVIIIKNILNNLLNNTEFFNHLDKNNTQILELIDQYQIPLMVSVAMIFIMVNLLFKITAAPFNMWAPRIYEGAPLASVMFLSIFSKIAVIFFMLRLFLSYFYDLLVVWVPVLLLCGLGSMITAIVGAMSETKIKRFFVYSSMSHVGLMLFGLACANIHGGQVVVLYLMVYTLTSLGGWTIIMLLTDKIKKIDNKKIIYITGLKGLSKNHAILSFFFAIIMLSMAGIPPLAGFFAKFEILYALTEVQLFSITFIALLLSVISFFYYLRIIKVLYFDNIKNYFIQVKQNEEKFFILSLGFLFTIFFVLYMQQPLLYCIRSIFKIFFKEIYL